jgi:hypothetical protein
MLNPPMKSNLAAGLPAPETVNTEEKQSVKA